MPEPQKQDRRRTVKVQKRTDQGGFAGSGKVARGGKPVSCRFSGDVEQLLRSLDNISDFIQTAVSEKLERLNLEAAHPSLRSDLILFNLPYPFTLKQLKTQYRKLAFQYHPDSNPDVVNTEIMFRRVQSVYERLSNHCSSSGD